MRRILSPVLLLSATSFFIAGCSGLPNDGTPGGGSTSGGTPSSVTLTPGSASLHLGDHQQFTASVAGASDQTVEWEVNNVPGGSASPGFISEGGVYLAPAALPGSPTVTITAVSLADPTKTGSATIALSQKSGVNVAVNGSNAVATAQTFGPAVPFSATVTGSGNTTVTWQVNGVTGGSARTGTISSAGSYNPPHSVPVSTAANSDGQTVDVIITAVSQADSTASDSVDLIIVPPQQAKQTLPTLLGVSGGNINSSSRVGNATFCCGGTLGSELLRGGQKYILSNNHVLAGSDTGVAGSGASGDSILQPGLIDSQCSSTNTNTVANLSQFFNLETGSGTPVDAAIALVASGDVDPNGTISQLGGITSGGQPTNGGPHAGSGIAASLGETVAKSGRSTGLTCASINAINVQASVEYTKGCGTGSTFDVTYTDAISMGDGTFSAEGDSGSLIVDQTSADAVGLLFGGSDTDTVANPIADVLAQMADPATSAIPTVLGTASPHSVAACSLPGPQAGIARALQLAHVAANASAAEKSAAAREAHAAQLLSTPQILAIGSGASYDRPGEAAILLFVAKGQSHLGLPQELDGVGTRIVEAEMTGKRGVLSAADSAAAELSAPAALSVQSIPAAETARALVVHKTHAARWMKQAGVQGVGVTSSVDAPGEAALLIFLVRGSAQPEIPPVIDGLRTRVRVSSRFRTGTHQFHLPQSACTILQK
jgi:hypothetical protein